jgi:DNA-binding NtrC family response regulator
MTAQKRILVVDDEATVLLIFFDTLQALGDDYQTVTAQSGFEALKEARKKPFDLVITDLSMPGMDGVKLTEAIQALDPDTTVIWITAYGCHNVSRDAERLGIYSCRDKPMEVGEILEMVRDALGNPCDPESLLPS